MGRATSVFAGTSTGAVQCCNFSAWPIPGDVAAHTINGADTVFTHRLFATRGAIVVAARSTVAIAQRGAICALGEVHAVAIPGYVTAGGVQLADAFGAHRRLTPHTIVGVTTTSVVVFTVLTTGVHALSLDEFAYIITTGGITNVGTTVLVGVYVRGKGRAKSIADEYQHIDHVDAAGAVGVCVENELRSADWFCVETGSRQFPQSDQDAALNVADIG